MITGRVGRTVPPVNTRIRNTRLTGVELAELTKVSGFTDTFEPSKSVITRYRPVVPARVIRHRTLIYVVFTKCPIEAPQTAAVVAVQAIQTCRAVRAIVCHAIVDVSLTITACVACHAGARVVQVIVRAVGAMATGVWVTLVRGSLALNPLVPRSTVAVKHVHAHVTHRTRSVCNHGNICHVEAYSVVLTWLVRACHIGRLITCLAYRKSTNNY